MDGVGLGVGWEGVWQGNDGNGEAPRGVPPRRRTSVMAWAVHINHAQHCRLRVFERNEGLMLRDDWSENDQLRLTPH